MSEDICRLAPRSTMLTIIWAWPCDCMSPPINSSVMSWPSVRPPCIDEAGGERVVGPLVGRDHVGAVGIQGEQPAAIMQDEAIARHGETRAEIGVVAVDPGHHVAPAVGGREHDRVAISLAGAGGERARLGRADLAAQAFGIFRRSECLHLGGEAGIEVRIAVIGIEIGIGELLGLDQHVPVARIGGAHRGQSLARDRPRRRRPRRMLSISLAAKPWEGGGTSRRVKP